MCETFRSLNDLEVQKKRRSVNKNVRVEDPT